MIAHRLWYYFESTLKFSVVYFFFFQAEDGIRDYKVTGVQTCALPIYIRPLPHWQLNLHTPLGIVGLCRRQLVEERLLVQQMFPLSHHQLLGIERFFGVDCRAVERAPAALQARGHVEELFPGVFLHL